MPKPDLSRLSERSIAKRLSIKVAKLRDLVAEGCPRNDDGSFAWWDVAAWLVKRSRRSP